MPPSPQPAPVKIAYVIDTLSVPAGGTEQQLLALLDRLDRSRFVPHVFCLRSSPWLASEQHGFAWTDLATHVSARPSLLMHIHRFAHILERGRFDIVQTHFRDSNIVGVLAATRAGVRTILSTRRGVPYWSTRGGLWFLRQLNRRVTRFVANSHATKHHYVQAEQIDADRVEVIYNGLDPDRFRTLDPQQRLRLRTGLGIAATVPVVGLVANLRAVKGIDDFLRSASSVLRSHGDAHFVIVGQGPEEDSLRQLIAQLRIGSSVTMLGARTDVPELLQVFDVGVLASHFESFSNSILEYRAAGLPVVVTDVGGAREVVEDGREGFVVPPRAPELMAQRLCTILEHQAGARAWASGHRLAPNFHMEHMVKAHEELYAAYASSAQAEPGSRSAIASQ